MDIIQECMTMTSYGGEAKSLSIQAIRQARQGDFKKAEESLTNAKEALAKSHAAHSRLLTQDARDEDIRVSVFMLHAADHLASASTMETLAEEIVELCQEFVHV